MDDLDIPQNATPTLTGLDTPGADSPPLTGPAPSKRKVLTSEQREAKNAKAKARRAAKSNISTDSSPDSPAESDSTMSTSKKAKGKTAAPKKAKQTKAAKVAKPAKTAKKANAVKAKTNGHSAGPRGEKTKEIARLLQRKTGCTAAEVLEATGWPSVSMPAMAKACGLKLRKEKVKGSGERTHYFGS